MTTDLEILRADLAAARLPTSRRRVALFAAIAAATATAVAFAADHYLGQPAPAHVKATFARFAGWQHLDPVDPRTAKVAAFSGHSVLYSAGTASGGTCVELLGKGGFEYEVFCLHKRQGTGVLLFTGIPVHGTGAHAPPVVVAGQIGTGVSSLEARTAGKVERIRIGLDGFFAFEPANQAAARRGDTVLYGRDAGGSVVAHERVPAQLVLDTVGVPARIVHGVDYDPHAKRALFEIWAYRVLQTEHCRPKRHCNGPAYVQTGQTGQTEIAPGGTFTYVAPRMPGTRWYLSLVVADRRFIPIDPVGGWPVPDDAYWRKARTEAKG